VPVLVALCAPAAAHAQSTGGAAAPAASPSRVVAVTDGSFSLVTRADALLNRFARFRGVLPASEAGRTVTIERFEPLTGIWLPVATAVAGSDGTFIARWRTDHIGQFRVRARLDGDGAQASSATPEVGVTVYKEARATWYGPGFYGRKTACGTTMTHALLGVAHRTLPCGTQVALIYDGLTITVPVVDRGPFRNGAQWDLTFAAAQALGMTVTSRIGALRLRPAPAAPTA